MDNFDKFVGVANLLVGISTSAGVSQLNSQNQKRESILALQSDLKEFVFQTKQLTNEIIDDLNMKIVDKLFILRFILDRINKCGIDTNLFLEFSDKEYFQNFKNFVSQFINLNNEKLSDEERADLTHQLENLNIYKKTRKIELLLGGNQKSNQLGALLSTESKVLSSSFTIQVKGAIVGSKLELYIDDHFEGNLKGNSSNERKISAEKHKISLKCNGLMSGNAKGNELEIVFEPYKTHRFLFNPKMGLWEVTPNIKYIGTS